VSHIFISHSSKNVEWALRLKCWLEENGWPDFFLDLDPERGIKAGERWKVALQKAAYRCEAVLALVSPEWLASSYCKAEIDAARLLNKKIIVALIAPVDPDALADLREEQWVDLVSDPNGFLKLKIAINQAGLDPASFPLAAGRRLYPGLAALDENDAAIFFGRDGEVVKALDKIRGLSRSGVVRSLIIVGASGAGKSSFLRAGLWPRLKRDDRSWLPLPVIRPERGAISGSFGLARALQNLLLEEPFASRLRSQSLPKTRGAIASFISTEKGGFERLIAAIREAGQPPTLGNEALPPPTVILSIDQGEELFNEEGRREARLLLELLTEALSTDPHLFALIAMRSDAFSQLQNDPLFVKVEKDVFSLDMMQAGSYREVIEGPARLAQPKPLKIDPRLTLAILEDIAKQDALPLLAFALERLYENFAAEGRLTLAHYEALGGLKGAIAAAVEDALSAAMASGDVPKDPKAQSALIAAAFIPHLVRVNVAGQFVRRVATSHEIAPSALALLSHLSKARLVVKDHRDTPAGEADTFEVAHEALFRVWSALGGILENEREFLSGKSQLEEDTAEWLRSPEKKKSGALLSDNKLARAREWLTLRPQDLAIAERQYIQASIDRESSRRRFRFIAAVTGFVLISLFAAFAAVQWREARKEAAKAEKTTLLALESSNNLIARIRALFERTAISSAATRDLLATAEQSINAQLQIAHTSGIYRSIAELLILFSDVHSNLGETDKALESAEKALTVTRNQPRKLDEIHLWRALEYESLCRIADALTNQSKPEQGYALYQDAQAIAEGEIKTDPNASRWKRKLAFIETKVGDYFFMSRKLQDAIGHYNRSFDLYSQLLKEASDDELQAKSASITMRIADLLVLSDRKAALEKYRTALEMREKLEEKSPDNEIIISNIAINHTKIGDTLALLGDNAGALKEQEISFQYRAKLALKDPTNELSKSQHAYGYYYLGKAQWETGDSEAALTNITTSVELRRELVAKDSTNFSWKLNLGTMQLDKGGWLTKLGRRTEAIATYRAALAVFEQLLSERPKGQARRKDVVRTKIALGDVLLAESGPAAALEEYRAALPIAESLLQEESSNNDFLFSVWSIDTKIATAFKAKKDQGKALEYFQKALPVIERLAARNPGNAEWQSDAELTRTAISDAAQTQ
jgi:tetratricopeptide (TPR) repeat protein